SDSEQAKTYYHYVCDYAGSTSHVLNEQGEVENEYMYDAFGNITASREKVPNRFCYTGEQYDRIPNQYYLRARYYNPVIGRFTQQDTYLGAGLNLYAYCNGNPLSYVDPSGHNPTSASENKQLPMVIPQPGTQLPAVVNKPTVSNKPNTPDAPQSTALMVIPQPGTQLPVVYKPFNYGIPASPGGDTNPSTALAPVAPFGSYEIVPFRNDAGTNPLDTAQRSAVAEAVSDAGGTTVETLAGGNINHINGSIGELHGYQDAINNGEIGIQAPGKVTASGPDFITYNPNTGRVNIWDSKYSSKGKWPKTAKGFGTKKWLDETKEAIENISDTTLRDEIMDAFNNGKISWIIYKWPQ
ncbi:MAG: hypothetical protein IKK33_16180, partial [Lachnospiraceae bacterium]|nr:hypothetical protein [Lachnospiraceae bacterium]